ncbi:hypothetical protein MRX96_007409 [Rhipicephalus microplus]
MARVGRPEESPPCADERRDVPAPAQGRPGAPTRAAQAAGASASVDRRTGRHGAACLPDASSIDPPRRELLCTLERPVAGNKAPWQNPAFAHGAWGARASERITLSATGERVRDIALAHPCHQTSFKVRCCGYLPYFALNREKALLLSVVSAAPTSDTQRPATEAITTATDSADYSYRRITLDPVSATMGAWGVTSPVKLLIYPTLMTENFSTTAFRRIGGTNFGHATTSYRGYHDSD